ncbi:MFS general substrate transporter [Apiospora saccharicola]
MNPEDAPASCCVGQAETPTSSPRTLEKARLRRNQRNSRARKQAYIRDLENRWNECVRLGAQATVEMQREARRVQEENGLLRQLLHSQGMSHDAVQTAISSMKVQVAAKKAASQSEPNSEGMPCNKAKTIIPQRKPSSSDRFTPTRATTDPDEVETLDFTEWLNDLCDIKDAFGLEATPPPPPPDGGYGWVCVAAQFLINGFTWGVAASYSVYLGHYLSHGLFSEARPLDYAFIGGFNFAFALLVAPLATFLARRYGVRVPMLAGVALLPTGFIAASFAQRVWHLYLSQGLCVGLGIGLIYIPATAIIPQWFERKRSLANGICAAGSGVGGLIVCFSTQAMLDHVGYAWSLRITAAIVVAVNLLATLLVRSRDKEIHPDQRIFNFGLLRGYEAKLLVGWSFVLMFGYITLMFSLSDYAKEIGRSDQEAATVPALLNLGAALGRPLIGFASDRLGRVEVAGVLTFACGVLVFGLWLPTTSYAALGVFATISGAILGIFWAVIGALAAEIVGLKELPAFLSVTWIVAVPPCLFAEVVALELRRPGFGKRSYIYVQAFAGTSYILSSFLLLELWRVRRRRKNRD